MAKLKEKKNKARTPFAVEFDREEDGRWIAEVRELPGVMAYGTTKQEALRKVYTIVLRTLADKAEEGQALLPLSRLLTYGMARR